MTTRPAGATTKHGTPRRQTDAEYAEMARDHEATPITGGEILSAEINPGFLPTNRRLEDRDPKQS